MKVNRLIVVFILIASIAIAKDIRTYIIPRSYVGTYYTNKCSNVIEVHPTYIIISNIKYNVHSLTFSGGKLIILCEGKKYAIAISCYINQQRQRKVIILDIDLQENIFSDFCSIK